jgi:hypothetical protein
VRARRLVHPRGMQIIIDIQQGEDGRPIGTVRRAEEPQARSFSGNLEFLALIESLYQTDTTGVGNESTNEGKRK